MSMIRGYLEYKEICDAAFGELLQCGKDRL